VMDGWTDVSDHLTLSPVEVEVGVE
jgi:hypothetical protein